MGGNVYVSLKIGRGKSGGLGMAGMAAGAGQAHGPLGHSLCGSRVYLRKGGDEEDGGGRKAGGCREIDSPHRGRRDSYESRLLLKFVLEKKEKDG